MPNKLASQADLWYNRRVKILLPEDVASIAQAWINLYRRFIMTTLPPHAQDGNLTRICNRCNREFPLTSDHFAKSKVHKGGFRNQCKECTSKRNKAYRESHPEKVKSYYEQHREEKLHYAAQYHAEHKEKHAQYNAQYRAEHREEIREQRAKTYVERREYFRERNTKSYAAHKEARRSYAAKYRAEHPEEVARYRELHREEHRQYDKQYQQEHRTRKTLYQKQYRIDCYERLSAWRKKYRQLERVRIAARIQAHKRKSVLRNAEGSHTVKELQDQLKRQKSRCYYCHKKLGKWRNNWHADHIVPLSKGGSNDIHNIVIACPTCNMHKSGKLLYEWNDGGRLL